MDKLMDLNITIELQSRAIIGDIRNMSLDCLERPRPRVQYIHFWRNIKKKINTVLSFPEKCEQTETIKGLKIILDSWKNPVNSDSEEISKRCLEYLGITWSPPESYKYG